MIPLVCFVFSFVHAFDVDFLCFFRCRFKWPQGEYAFNQSYASWFAPIDIDATLLVGARRVEIVSIITGHGSDSNGCGEFCNTTHRFYWNDRAYAVRFDNAGTSFGCADRVRDGAVPNEHGTWLYGRDGWCDGLQVEPNALSVDLATLAPKRNVLVYNATNEGQAPNPIAGSGFAVMDFFAFVSVWK